MFESSHPSLLAAAGAITLPILADWAAKTSVVFAVALVTTLLMRKSSAARRHLVWIIAFLAFLMIPTLSMSGLKWQVLPNWLNTHRLAADVDQPVPSVAARDTEGDGDETGRDNVSGSATPSPGQQPSKTIVASRSSLAAATAEQASPKERVSWQQRAGNLLAVVWFAGVAMMVLRIVFSRIMLRRLVQASKQVEKGRVAEALQAARRRVDLPGQHRVRVYLSSRRSTPMTWGLLSNDLLLPADAAEWDRRRLNTVLTHELSHVKRYDTVTHVLAQLACAFFWFHPLVWLAASHLGMERERACDDSVLDSGLRASDYAEDLLQLLHSKTVPSGALAMITKSGLEGRLKAILSEETNRRATTTAVCAVALLLGLSGASGVAMLQAKPAPESAPPAARSAKRVQVVCVDDKGKPVAGAEIHLFQFNGKKNKRYVHSGPFTSDANGKALCSEAMLSSEAGTFDRWIYARVAGRLVGVARCTNWKHRTPSNPQGRVKMRPSKTVTGQITVPDGFDPTTVTVRVQTLHVFSGPKPFDYESFPRSASFSGLEQALPKIFETRPDAKGRIRFADVPARGRMYLLTSGKGLGEAQWRNDKNEFLKPIELNIEKESSFSGRVLLPSGKPAVGIKVGARLMSGGRRRNFYLTTFPAVTDAKGRFTVRGMPQTEFALYLKDPRKQTVFRPREGLLVSADEPGEMELRMETGVLVSGRVFDPEGKPLAGAGFSAVTETNTGSGLADTVTDDDGDYEIRLPSGAAKLYFNSLPPGFTYPRPAEVKRLNIKSGQAAIKNLNFTVPRKKKEKAGEGE